MRIVKLCMARSPLVFIAGKKKERKCIVFVGHFYVTIATKSSEIIVQILQFIFGWGQKKNQTTRFSLSLPFHIEIKWNWICSIIIESI